MFRTLVAAAGLLAVLAVGAGAAHLECQVLNVATDTTNPPIGTVDEAIDERLREGSASAPSEAGAHA